MFFYLFLVLSTLGFDLVHCLHNVTVDDQDPSIVYTPPGSWARSVDNSLDVGGAHMLTQDPNGRATLNFTGVAIYFLSPLWPYPVNTAVSLDNGPITLVDLVDHSRPQDPNQGPETVQSTAVWGASGLANTQHTLVVSVGAGQPFGIVDAFMYTILDPEDTGFSSDASSATSTSASTTTTGRIVASSTASATPAPTSSSHVLPVALGTVLGVLGLLIILVAFWFCRRQRRRPASEAWTVEGAPNMAGPPPLAPRGQYASHQTVAGPQYNHGYAPNHDPNTYYDPGYGAAGAQQPHAYAAAAYHPSQAPGDPYNTWPGQDPVGQPPPPLPSNRAPNRTFNQMNTLSTITENSTPPFAEGRSQLANSPQSNPSELGYQTAAEGSERASSIPSEQPHSPSFSHAQTSGYQPQSQLQPYYNVPKDPGGKMQEYASASTSRMPEKGRYNRPPAYTPK